MADRPATPALPARRGRHRRGRAAGRARRWSAGTLSRLRTPDRLPGIVDAHCHLQHARFDADRDEVIDRARRRGVERILVPGWDLASSEAALELAARHAPLVMAAVGVHPHDASSLDEAGWQRLEALAADGRCAAVGEIGLDFHRNLSPPEVQADVFERQLAMAARLTRPVVVHDRDAHEPVRAALTRWAERLPRPHPGMLHAFSGDLAMAGPLAAAGYLVSLALPVTFRSATGPREAVVALPDGSLLVETDAPYLGPVVGERNEPANVLRVAAAVAALRGTTPDALGQQVRTAFDAMPAR